MNYFVVYSIHKNGEPMTCVKYGAVYNVYYIYIHSGVCRYFEKKDTKIWKLGDFNDIFTYNMHFERKQSHRLGIHY